MMETLLIGAVLVGLTFFSGSLNLSKTQIFGWITGATSVLAPFALGFGIELPQAELVNLVEQLYASTEVITAELEKVAVAAVSAGTGVVAAAMIVYRKITNAASGFFRKE